MKKTFDDIKTIAGDLITEDADRDALYQDLEDLWLLEDADTPDTKNDYTTRSPSPNTVPRQIANVLSTNPVTIAVQEGQETKGAKEASGRVKAGLDAAWWQLDQDAGIVGQLVIMSVVYGRAVLKTLDLRPLWKYMRLSEKEIEDLLEQGAFQFSSSPCHPKNIHTARGPHQIDYVVEVQTQKLRWLRSFYGDKVSWIDGDDTVEGTYYEYWDNGVNCAWWGGDDSRPIIPPTKHGGVIPYSDFMVQDQSFLNNRKHAAPSFLYPLHASKISKRLNAAYTIWMNNLAKLGNSGFKVVTKDGNGVEVDLSKPGAVVNLMIGEDVVPLMDARITPMLAQAYANLKSDEEACTLSRVIAGVGPSGVTAGFAIGMLTQGAATALLPFQQSVQRCIGDALRKVCSYVRLNGDVEVWGENKLTKLLAEDMDRRMRVEVHLKARLPQDRVADTQVARALTESGLVSKESIVEDVLEMDSELEQGRRYVEAAADALAPLHIFKYAKEKGWASTPEEEAMLAKALGLQPKTPATAEETNLPVPEQPPPPLSAFPGAMQQDNAIPPELMQTIAAAQTAGGIPQGAGPGQMPPGLEQMMGAPGGGVPPEAMGMGGPPQ